jgi:eukaryotic-like serine/threonine-protein kinase
MDSDLWNRVSSLASEALDLPEAEREAFVRQRCGSDPAALEAVLDMLAAEREMGDFLGEPIDLDEDPPAEAASFGRYKVIREIGHGGMSIVYLAERHEENFDQRVAIKLLLHQAFRSLPETEIGILAGLEHPNIARFLDAGIAPSGLRYLVMEYVDGIPCNEYCHTLKDDRQRLRLFLQICAGVAHANRSLVIHRDLKPGNVFVTKDGVVKLLDFGIAKVLSSVQAQDQTVGIRAFTPDYASPEQILGEPTTTATDVYSLGVLLCELLGGHRPRDLSTLPTAEAVSIVQTEITSVPLQGDLALIARKALRRDPTQRYESASALAKDIERYLAGLPVEARAPSWTYRASKFISRNRYPVAAATAVLAAILGGLGYVAFQNRQIERERDRAENVARFLKDLFAAADPERNQGTRLTAKELLDLGANRVRSISDPKSRAALLDTMGEAYFNLGLYEKAESLYAEFIASKPEPARLSHALAIIAEAQAFRGRFKDADVTGARAVALSAGLGPGDRAVILQRRCNQQFQSTDFKAAIESCKEAWRVAEQSSLNAIDRADIGSSLGTALLESAQFKESEQAFQDALRLARSNAAEPLNSASAQALGNLAVLYFRQGRFQEAEQSNREAVEIKRKLYPDGHLELARSLNNLANNLATLNRSNEAIAIYQEAHGYYRKALGPESSELASSLSNMAIAYSTSDRLELAEKIMAQVIDMQARTIGEYKLPHISSLIKYASLTIERGKMTETIAVLEKALAAADKLDPQPKVQSGYGRLLLAQSLLESGNPARALVVAREGEAILRPILRPGHWMLEHTDIAIGGALVATGKKADGLKLLQPFLTDEVKKKRNAKTWWLEAARRASARIGVGGS